MVYSLVRLVSWITKHQRKNTAETICFIGFFQCLQLIGCLTRLPFLMHTVYYRFILQHTTRNSLYSLCTNEQTWHNHWHTIIQSHTITSIQSFNQTPWHNHWRTIIQPHTITSIQREISLYKTVHIIRHVT